MPLRPSHTARPCCHRASTAVESAGSDVGRGCGVVGRGVGVAVPVGVAVGVGVEEGHACASAYSLRRSAVGSGAVK